MYPVGPYMIPELQQCVPRFYKLNTICTAFLVNHSSFLVKKATYHLHKMKSYNWTSERHDLTPLSVLGEHQATEANCPQAAMGSDDVLTVDSHHDLPSSFTLATSGKIARHDPDSFTRWLSSDGNQQFSKPSTMITLENQDVLTTFRSSLFLEAIICQTLQHETLETVVKDAFSFEPLKLGRYLTAGTDLSPRREAMNESGETVDCWHVYLENCMDRSKVSVFSRSTWPPGIYATKSDDTTQIYACNKMATESTQIERAKTEPKDGWWTVTQMLGSELPTQSPGVIFKADTYLKPRLEFYDIFVKWVENMGGKNHNHCFVRVMDQLLTNEGRRQYSWAGQLRNGDGKIAFKEFKSLLGAIFDGVCRGMKMKGTDWSMYELEECLKQFLKGSKVSNNKKEMETRERSQVVKTTRAPKKTEKIKTPRVMSDSHSLRKKDKSCSLTPVGKGMEWMDVSSL